MGDLSSAERSPPGSWVLDPRSLILDFEETQTIMRRMKKGPVPDGFYRLKKMALKNVPARPGFSLSRRVE